MTDPIFILRTADILEDLYFSTFLQLRVTLSSHYADDTQLYITVGPKDADCKTASTYHFEAN